MNSRFLRYSLLEVLIGFVFLSLPFATEKITVARLPIYIPELFVCFALIAFGVSYFWKRNIQEPFSRETYFFIAGALLVLLGATISMLSAPILYTMLGQWKSWFVVPIAFFLLLLLLKKSATTWSMWLFLWFLGTAGMSVFSLIQYLNGVVTYDNRLAAPFLSPNMLALFLEPAILIGLWLSLTFSGKKKQLVLLLLLLIVLAIGATRSYAALVSVAVASLSIIWFFGIEKQKRYFLLFLTSTLLFAVLAFEIGTEKWQDFFQGADRSSFASRMMIWQAAGQILLDHPIVGIGIGRFQEVYLAYQQYFLPYLEWAVPHPHNLVLAIWLETGFIGLVGFLGLFGNIFWRWFVFCSQMKDVTDKQEKQKRLPVLAAALLILMLVHGLVDTPYFGNALAYFFWATLALSTYSNE